MSAVHVSSGKDISVSAILSADAGKIYLTLMPETSTVSFWISLLDAQLLSSVINKALLEYQETKEQP